jgi:hypothetical protein
MYRQSGVAAVGIVAAVAVLAVGGVGFVAWQKSAEADRFRMEAASHKAGLDQARAEVRKLTQDSSTAVKEASTLKVTTERLAAERDAVRKSLEGEQAAGVQLRAELQLAKDQVSYLSARSSKDIVRGMPKAPTTPVSAPQRK